MAAPFQSVEVPFVGALDTKTNPHLVDVRSFKRMENCYQDQTGRVRPRNGGRGLPKLTTQGRTVLSARQVMTRDRELVLHDGNHLFAWSPGFERWSRRTLLPPCEIRTREITSGVAGDMNYADMAVIGDMACVAMRDRALVYDRTSGATVWPTGNDNLSLINSRQGKLIGLTQVGVFLHADQDGQVLLTSKIELNDGEPSRTLLNGFLSAEGPSDLCTVDGESFSMVPYGSGLGAGLFLVASVEDANKYLRLGVYQADATRSGSTYIGSTTYANEAPQLCYDPENVVAYVLTRTSGGDLYVSKFDVDNDVVNLVAGPALVASGVVENGYSIGMVDDAGGSSGGVFIFYTEQQAGVSKAGARCTVHVKRASPSLSVSASPIGSFSGAHVASQTVGYGTHGYAVCYITPDTGKSLGSMGLVRSDGELVAIWGVHETYWMDQGGLGIFNLCILGGGRFVCPFLRVDSFFESSSSYNATLMEVEISLAPAQLPAMEVGGTLYVGGGCLRRWDGLRTSTPMIRPRFIDGESMETSTSGGSLSDGTYGVAAVIYYRDSQGNEHYSAPAFYTVTLSGGGSSQQFRLVVAGGTVPLLDMVKNPVSGDESLPWNVVGGDARVLYFCTAVNGSIYYLQETVRVNGAPSAITDISTDTPVLYTTGGVLANESPPCPVAMATDGSVAAAIPGDRRDTVWVSKPIVDGLGVEFSESLVYPVPGEEGTALAFLDGRLVVFRTGSIRLFVGSPPTSVGSGGYLGTESIADDVGAESHHSVQRIQGEAADGIIFKSSRGFFLLDRSLRTIYIGHGVDSYNPQNVVSSAVLSESRQVRFVMSGGDVLVFDYHHGRWSVFTFDRKPVTSAAWGGAWVYAESSANTVIVEGLSDWSDNGVAYSSALRIGWLRSHLAGWMRVRRVGLQGRFPETGTVNDWVHVLAYRNYNESTSPDEILHQISGTLPRLGAAAGRPFQLRQRLAVQKLESLSIEVRWGSVNAEEALSLSGIVFEVASKPGASRLGRQSIL